MKIIRQLVIPSFSLTLTLTHSPSLSNCSLSKLGYTTECRSPEDLSVLVLNYLKQIAENYLIHKKILRDENDLQIISNTGIELPTKLYRVVIGVPHTFTVNQRNATIRAAERAGFTEVYLFFLFFYFFFLLSIQQLLIF